MADLSTLVNAFVSQAQDPSLVAKPSWQDELRKQMDPEQVKRQNISNALAAAAVAIGNNKGGAFHGLSQDIVAGAQNYAQGNRDALRQRVEDMKSLDDSQLQRRLQGLELLSKAIGIQGGQEDRADTRQYRKDSLAIRRDEIAARRASAASRTGGPGESSGILPDGTKSDRETPAISDPGNTIGNGGVAGGANGSKGPNEEMRRLSTASSRFFSEVQSINTARINAGQPELNDEEKQGIWNEYLDKFKIRHLYDQPGQDKQSDQTQTQSYPSAAADYLRKNPQFRDQFDAKYGQGAAASVLGN